MDVKKIGFLKYEIIGKLENDLFLCKRKGKEYLFRFFTSDDSRQETFFYNMNLIENSGIDHPKIIYMNKKKGLFLCEYIKGEILTNFLAKSEFLEDFYQQLFKNSYMAKINKLSLNFEPDNWIVANNKLYYISDFVETYKKENDFAVKDLKLYFQTKAAKEYLTHRNIDTSSFTVKNEYETNKEMVLITCKYYK